MSSAHAPGAPANPGPAAFLPDPGALAARLQATLPGFQQVGWLSETGSTNADLLERARQDHGQLMRPWLLGTHLQTQGRGRAGRTWHNQIGDSLMFSCAFDVFLPARQLPALAPLLGMASCEALRSLLQPGQCPRLAMKWPNDLLWDQAKLAGILIESSRTGTSPVSDHHLIIIGMGLNLRGADTLADALNRRVADWSRITAADPAAAQVDAGTLVGTCARAWHQALNRVTAHGLADLPERFAQVDALAGLPIDVLDDGHLQQTGVACGIDSSGHLLLRNAAGLHAISVGEISARVAS
ncbi:biotin--[acetyl-CoA-carboxylase] ligase [Castellaniella sp.]|uniref:biotin--[acetyl-CoA-carboxylase] ligase n=1 Tax=Castellaniella sp. TaxID=1955812 RepID=UPI003567EF5C